MINSILTKNSPGGRWSGGGRARGGSLPPLGPSAPSPRRSKLAQRGAGDVGLEPTGAAAWKRPVSFREGVLPAETRLTGARTPTRVSAVRGAGGSCPGEITSVAGRSPRGTPVPGTRTTWYSLVPAPRPEVRGSPREASIPVRGEGKCPVSPAASKRAGEMVPPPSPSRVTREHPRRQTAKPRLEPQGGSYEPRSDVPERSRRWISVPRLSWVHPRVSATSAEAENRTPKPPPPPSAPGTGRTPRPRC